MDFMVSNFCEEECGRVYNTAKEASSGRRTALLGRRRFVSERDSDMENRLPPEMELGNIEYKAKLVSPSLSRLEHLITQMKWRLSEGLGEAIYELGVEDDGRMVGLTDEEYEESMRTIRKMADALSADVVECTERELLQPSDEEQGNKGERRRVAEILVRRVPESQPFIESRLALLGGADVGKSTLCGVLTHGTLDDGNGKTRLNQFRYLHEFQTGKTSSVCQDMVAFDSKGRTLNFTASSVSEMIEEATKVVHLLDLAGDRKYMNTTIRGLSAYKPNACCLVVSATTGPTHVTREHLGLLVALSLPFFVVVTKRDAVDMERLRHVFALVKHLLQRAGVRGGTLTVKRKRDAVRSASLLSSPGGPVPLLSVSSVDGGGLKCLRTLLNALPPSTAAGPLKEQLLSEPPLFTIEETFQVPHVGEVACGVLAEGRLRIRDQVLVGPGRDGTWRVAVVASVRRAKLPVLSVEPGQAVSLSLLPADERPEEPLALRRGMVLRAADAPRTSCQRLTAQLLLLSHAAGTIAAGFEATFFIGGVRQPARVEKVEGGALRTGVCSTVELRFLSSYEFVRPGTPLIFRHGKTRGMGEVVQTVDEVVER